MGDGESSKILTLLGSIGPVPSFSNPMPTVLGNCCFSAESHASHYYDHFSTASRLLLHLRSYINHSSLHFLSSSMIWLGIYSITVNLDQQIQLMFNA